METIKFYRNIEATLKSFYSIVFTSGFMIIGLLCFIVFLSHYSASLELIIAILFLLLCAFIGALIYASKKIYQTYQKRKLITLEISEEGFCYPYCLDDSTLILWSDIQQIEMVEFGAKYVDQYIVVELKNGTLNDDSAKEKYVKSYCDHFQKNYSEQISVIPRLIASDYSLEDLMGLLRCYWKADMGPESFDDHPYGSHCYLYKDESLVQTFYKVAVILFLFFTVVPTFKEVVQNSLFKDVTFVALRHDFSFDALVQAFMQKPAMMVFAVLMICTPFIVIFLICSTIRSFIKFFQSNAEIRFCNQWII